MADDHATEALLRAQIPSVAELNAAGQGSLVEALGIHIVEASPERMVMTMPVSPATKQPLGILHGGATVALAETAASVGTWLGIDHNAFDAVGLEINCNHLRAKRDGVLMAVGTPVHRGRRNWVWDIRVTDETDTLVAIARCTMAVVPRRG